MTLLVVVVLDVVAGALIAALLVEVRVAVLALSVFHIAIAMRAMVVTLVPESSGAVDHVVDEVAKGTIIKTHHVRTFKPEQDRVDRPTLIVGGVTGSATRRGAPTVVILPTGSGVAKYPIHVHLDDVIVRPIEEIDC